MWDLDEQLILAAMAGDLAGVQASLAAGADIHTEHDRPLIQAAMHGHLPVVQYLLEAGAYRDALEEEALRWAAHHGHLAVVQCLLRAGADVHAQRDIALRTAIQHGHTKVVQLLLDAGADVHVDDDSEDPEDIPLSQAVEHGHQGVVRCLLAAGANPNVSYGSAMLYAVIYKRPEIFTALIHAGGSLNWLSPALQIHAVSDCEADKISVAHLAGQSVCTEALLVLLARQGQTGLVATLKATQLLETLDPAGRVALLGDLLGEKPPEHTQASPI